MSNRWTSASVMVVGLALASTTSAQITEVAERFTYTVPGAPESAVDGKGPLRLTVHRWSTDAERDQVAAAVSGGGSPKLLDALRDVGGIAYLRLPGGLEYTVRYARRTTRPDGHTDVVLVADRPVWMWWDAARSESARSGEARFSVIQIRIGAQGAGEGRVSSGTAITSDKDAGVALADFEKQTVLLTDVRRDRT